MQWHRITDPNEPELDRLAASYSLHPLHIEDCRHRNEIAKVEEQETYLFVVLKPLDVAADHSVTAADLDIFIGRDFVITVEENCHDRIRVLLSQIQSQFPSIRPDQLFHKILDGIVDDYFPILDHFDNAIDELEDSVLNNASPKVLSASFDAKRSLIQVRRVLVPTRDALARLQRANHPFIDPEM